jgi:hypothetical protein
VHTGNFQRNCGDTVLIPSIDPPEKKYQPKRRPAADQYLTMTPSIEQGQRIQPNENIDMQKRHKSGQYGAEK